MFDQNVRTGVRQEDETRSLHDRVSHWVTQTFTRSKKDDFKIFQTSSNKLMGSRDKKTSYYDVKVSENYLKDSCKRYFFSVSSNLDLYPL